MKWPQRSLSTVAMFDPPNPRQVAGANEEMDVSFVKMAAVSAETGTITLQETRRLNEVLTGFTYFQDSDILVAKITPCFENGKIAQARIPHIHGFGSTEFHVIRADRSKLDARYLFHFLRLPHVRLAGERRMTGSAGQRRVPRNFLETLQISMPPLEEQRRIAAILDQAEALRSKRRQALAKLDTLTQSLFLEMFGDPRTNPKLWKITKIGEIADVQGGLQVTPLRAAHDLQVPYLRVANVYRDKLDVAETKTIGASQNEFVRTQLQPGDVLIVEGHGNPNEIGRCAVWDGSINGCVHQNHLIRVRFNPSALLPSFGSSFLNSPVGRRQLLGAARTRSGLNTINVSNVKGVKILAPPISLQSEYCERSLEIQRAKCVAIRQHESLDRTFASLQHRAFNGDL